MHCRQLTGKEFEMIAHRNTFTVIRRFHGNSAMNKQRGAVAVIVALSMVGLLAFAGLALDLGKLFVTKTELQNSADACALSASRELTGANTNQLELAEAAGIAAGISNSVMFQGEPVAVGSGNITFSETLNGGYVGKDGAADPLAMRYVRCTVERTGIVNWFMQVLGIGSQQVSATAVATMAQGQTFAAFPIAVCSDQIATKSPGDWFDPRINASGNVIWANFSGQGTRTLEEAITGNNVTDLDAVDEEIGDAGQRKSLFTAWNTRFGIVKKGEGHSYGIPDYTGASYTGTYNDSQCSNAFADFIDQRGKNTPYQFNDGLKINGDSSSVDQHKQGGDRRLIAVPVVDCSSFCGGSKTATVVNWACVLMLHPLDENKPNDEAICSSITTANACPKDPKKSSDTNFMYLEYLGLADDLNSPCGSNGMTGGADSKGARVPTLVQ